MAAGCENWNEILNQTFCMIRKTLEMADPSPKSKPMVRQGSPHPKRIKLHADRGDDPATWLSPQSGMQRYDMERAASAGGLRGTAAEMEAAGFRGRGIRELEEEQRFTDANISPYRTNEPPQFEHDQNQAPLKTMRKPTTGVINYKRKQSVQFKRRMTRITFPKEEPVSYPNVLLEKGQIRGKQSPERKPWDWPCEQKFPGSTKPQIMMKEIKYKLMRVQRKLQEIRKGGVQCREPTLGSEKRFGNLDFQYVRAPHRHAAYAGRQADEERELRAARKEYTENQRREMLTRGSSPSSNQESPQSTQSLPGYQQSVYGTPPSAMGSQHPEDDFGSPGSQASWMPPPASPSSGGSPGQFPVDFERTPTLEEASEFANFAEEMVMNMCPRSPRGNMGPESPDMPPTFHQLDRATDFDVHAVDNWSPQPTQSGSPGGPNICSPSTPQTWL